MTTIKVTFRAAAFGCAALLAVPAVFGGYGDPPDATHAWAVHDMNRPVPKKIVADGVKPPSDAIVLFDGTQKSLSDNWCDRRGNPTRWELDPNGELISVRGAGYIFTKRKFADCQLHVEWAAPKEVHGSGQGRGNSGVFLMGEYEIQVLDSYETDPDRKPNPNPCYPDGQAGAVYGQNPPAVNPARAPGVFNTYDIIFHAPVLNGDGTVKMPATITVLFNGVVVQDGWKFDGPTLHCRRAAYSSRGLANLAREKRMPFALQDHGNPVHYRNIWIRELPAQDAYAEHGNYFAVEEKVMERRRMTADMLDSDFAAKWGGAKVGRRLVEAWNIAMYFATPDRLARIAALESEFLVAAKGLSARDLPGRLGASKDDVLHCYGQLEKVGLAKRDNAVAAFLRGLK